MGTKSEKLIEEAISQLDYTVLITGLKELNEKLITYAFWMDNYINQVGKDEAEHLPKFVWTLYDYLTYRNL